MPSVPDSTLVELDGGGATPRIILTESHKFLLPQRSPKKVTNAKGIPQITCIHTGAQGIAMADILEIVFALCLEQRASRIRMSNMTTIGKSHFHS